MLGRRTGGRSRTMELQCSANGGVSLEAQARCEGIAAGGFLYNLWKVESFQIAQPIKAHITARPPESHAHRFLLSSAHVAEEFLHIIQKGISIMAQEQKGSIPKYMLFFFYSFQIFTQQYMKLNSTIHKKDSTFTKTISTFDILIVEMTF